MELDPREWRPQAFGRRHARDVKDALVEPGWDGTRVIVRVRAGKPVEVADADGEDVADTCGVILDAVAEAVLAESAVLDGYLTYQATQTLISTIPESDTSQSLGAHMSRFMLGGAADILKSDRPSDTRVRGTGEPVRPKPSVEVTDEEGEPVLGPLAFVAVDLLAVDDQDLLDVPLLERKRILDSVVEENLLVRRTPYVREPLTTFINSWRAAGFGELAYKDPNSRYRPGDENDGWALASMPRR